MENRKYVELVEITFFLFTIFYFRREVDGIRTRIPAVTGRCLRRLGHDLHSIGVPPMKLVSQADRI